MTRIALLGAGRIARVHAAAIAQSGAEISAIYDIDPNAAGALAHMTGARVAACARDAMGDADAVIIASSSATHVQYVLMAAKTGMPTLCEKPLADNLAATRDCVEMLGDNAGNVFLAFNRRFDTGHRALKDKIVSGALGTIEQLTITSRDPSPPPLEYIAGSGGIFRDMMIHDFDMARWLLGEEMVRLHAYGACLVDPQIGALGDYDTASVMMTTPAGQQVAILNSRRTTYGYDQRIEAFGSKGMAISDNPRKADLLHYGADQSGDRDPMHDFFMDRYADAYRKEILSFVEHAASGRQMPVNAIDGLRAAYLAEAAQDSAALGCPIELNSQSRVTWK